MNEAGSEAPLSSPIEKPSTGREQAIRSPWVIVLTWSLVSLVGMILLALAMNWLVGQPPFAEFAYEAVLPDGSLLVIEQITWGTSHSVKLTGLRTPGFFEFSYHNDTLSHSTSRDQVVVWMRRLDAQTRRPLDFTWWGESVLVDAFGMEIKDEAPYLDVLSQYGMSSLAGGRPFQPASPAGGMGTIDAIVVRSQFPLIRVEGETCELRVKNVDGEVVATFEIVFPGPRNVESWTPDPLPVTRADGELSVTLHGVGVYIDDSTTINNVRQYYRHLTTTQELVYLGEPTTNWHVAGIQVEDPLGNFSYGNDVRLSWGEPAWKMTLILDPVRVTPEPGQLTAPLALAVPSAGRFYALKTTQSVGGVTVEWHGIAGPEALQPLGPPTSSGNYSSTRSVHLNGEIFQLEYEQTAYPMSAQRKTLQLNGPACCLTGLLPGHSSLLNSMRVSVQITTPDGEQIPSETVWVDDVLAVVFQPPEGLAEIEAALVVQPFRYFEFFVAPPPLPGTEHPADEGNSLEH